MKYLTILFAVITTSIFTLAANAGDTVTQPQSAEHFYGVGWQNDGNHWSIEVLLGEKSGQIVYPSLECTGDWTLVTATPDKLHFIETIIEGKEDCVETGDIFLGPLPTGGFLYEWNEPGAKIAARAILFPVIAGKMSYMEALKVTLDSVDLDYMLPEYVE